MPRRRRQRKKKSHGFRNLAIVLIGLVLIMGYFIHGLEGYKQNEILASVEQATKQVVTTVSNAVKVQFDMPVFGSDKREQWLKNLEIAGRSNKNAQIIIDNKNRIPEQLIKLAGNNFDAIDFVAKYINKDVKDQYSYPKSIDGANFPYYMQWDSKWGYEKYGTGVLGYTGCGPTAVASIVSGLVKDPTITPSTIGKISEEHGYSGDYGTDWNLFPYIAKAYNLKIEKLPMDFKLIKEHLSNGHPILISVKPGEFTSVGHVMVMVGIDDNNMISIYDPNNLNNSQMPWDFQRLRPQIKSLWAFSK